MTAPEDRNMPNRPDDISPAGDTASDKADARMPERLDTSSADIAAQKRDELRALMPEVFCEDALDIDALRRVLGADIDAGAERFGLNWPGKADCMKLVQEASHATLRPCPDESVDFDTTQNLFIEGDNLEVLKLLQKSYFGQVKMIYIDPPYNTGKDFIYPDKFGETLDEYLKYTGQIDGDGKKLSTNTDADGRFHSKWLSMMYPRLYLAKNLLRDDGVIFISIDDGEVANLRKLCDHIFGEECWVATNSILNNPKGRALDKHFSNCHEYCLVYSKKLLPSGALSVSKTPDEIAHDYKEKDERGFYRLLELRNTHREFNSMTRPNLYYPFYVTDDGNVSLVAENDSTEILPIWDDGLEGCWTWRKERAEKLIEDIIAKRVKEHWKIYRRDPALIDGKPPQKKLKTIWQGRELITEKGQESFNNLFETKEKLFQSPKPIEFLTKCIDSSSQDTDIILDFFAGSAATAHAVMAQNAADGGNRRYIMVQLPEPCNEASEAAKAGYETIAEISKERIRRAAKKIADDNPDYDGDLGFRVFKLAASNFNRWYGIRDQLTDTTAIAKQLELHVDHINDAASDDDILYEIILNSGFALTDNLTRLDMAGKTVWQVGTVDTEGADMLVCLDRKLDQAVIDEMAAATPRQAVCLDAGFNSNDELKANAVQRFAIAARHVKREIRFRTI